MLVEIKEIQKELATSPIETIEAIVSTEDTTGSFIRRSYETKGFCTSEFRRTCNIQDFTLFVSEQAIIIGDKASSVFDDIDEEVSELLSVLYENQRKKTYNDCMYKIYSQFSLWNRSKLYSKCDRFLEYVAAKEFDIRILLSMLMASLPMKQHLNFRREFYDSVLQRARLIYSSNEIESIFVGLD